MSQYSKTSFRIDGMKAPCPFDGLVCKARLLIIGVAGGRRGMMDARMQPRMIDINQKVFSSDSRNITSFRHSSAHKLS